MTEGNGSGTPNVGWKKGLPQSDLKDAADWAAKLWDCARLSSTSLDVFAKALGLKSASGGAWDVRMAHLRGFKLIKIEGDQISLLPLGQRLINGTDQEQQVSARREAMHNLKAYKDLIDTYVGTSVPAKQSLAGRMEYEYGKTAAKADAAAQAFLDSLAFAQMISPSGLLTLDGKDVAAIPVGTVALNGVPEGGEDDDLAAEDIDAALEEMDAEEQQGEEPDDGDTMTESEPLVLRSSAGAISLAVTLDLSQFRAEEVVQILRELGLAKRK